MIKRFGHARQSAQCLSLNIVICINVRTEENDVDVCAVRLGPYGLGYLPTIHSWHLNVQQDHIKMPL